MAVTKNPKFDAFFSWLEKKFPESKFSVTDYAGQLQVNANGKQCVRYTFRQMTGYEDSRGNSVTSYNFSVVNVLGVISSTGEVQYAPSATDMRNLFLESCKKNPSLLQSLEYPGLLTKLHEAQRLLKSIVKPALDRDSWGEFQTGKLIIDFSVKDSSFLGGKLQLPAFYIDMDIPSSKYSVSSFGVKFEAKTLGGFQVLLEKTAVILKKGLAGLDSHDRDALTGKVTSEDVVTRILGVTSSFGGVDEWHDTSVLVTLMLSTSKPVSAQLLKKWVQDHWREVQRLALPLDKKLPKPAGRNPGYEHGDFPATGLGWILPSQVTFGDDGVECSQDGKRAVVEVRATHR